MLASRRHTETYGGGDFYEGAEWTRTDVYDDLMLRQANGAQTNVQGEGQQNLEGLLSVKASLPAS